MKKIISSLAVLVILASCKKEKTESPVQPAEKRVTGISYTNFNSSNQKISYDNAGRIIKLENDVTLFTYEFNGNSVLFKNFRKNENRYTAEVTGTLDSKGRLISGTGTFSYQPNSPYTSQLSFEYDASGYLVKETMNNSNGQIYVYEFTYTNGDVTKINNYFNGQLQFVEDYEYFTDKPDKTNLEVYKFDWYTNGLFGKTNQHLVKSGIGKNANVINPSWTNTYSYDLDGEGYPVKTTINSSSWGIYYLNYSYNQ
jgi:YD repeat-containing protein